VALCDYTRGLCGRTDGGFLSWVKFNKTILSMLLWEHRSGLCKYNRRQPIALYNVNHSVSKLSIFSSMAKGAISRVQVNIFIYT